MTHGHLGRAESLRPVEGDGAASIFTIFLAEKVQRRLPLLVHYDWIGIGLDQVFHD